MRYKNKALFFFINFKEKKSRKKGLLKWAKKRASIDK